MNILLICTLYFNLKCTELDKITCRRYVIVTPLSVSTWSQVMLLSVKVSVLSGLASISARAFRAALLLALSALEFVLPTELTTLMLSDLSTIPLSPSPISICLSIWEYHNNFVYNTTTLIVSVDKVVVIFSNRQTNWDGWLHVQICKCKTIGKREREYEIDW